MDEISAIAEDHGLWVIEDAAQAVGALYKGRKAGSLGDMGCFSFHPLKNIHALGDGGAVVTNDPGLYEKIIRLRNHGIAEEGVVRPGINSRLDEIHAAAMSLQLQFIDDIITFKRQVARKYSSALGRWVSIHKAPGHKRGVYQLYMIKTRHRDGLFDFLEKAGVQTGIHYRHYVAFHPYFLSRFGPWENLTVTKRLSQEVLSLPINYKMPDHDVDRVIRRTLRFFESNK